MTRKDWTLYIPFHLADWPGNRREDGSIVTVGDFLREAPLRQVFLYAREEYQRAPENHCDDLNAESIAWAVQLCRSVYRDRKEYRSEVKR